MPKFYSAKAIRTAVYLQNQTSTNGGVSPHELYFGKKPNLAHLRVFGSVVYVHVPKEKWRKLDAKSGKCILVGYSNKQNGYKCYNPRTKQDRRRLLVCFQNVIIFIIIFYFPQFYFCHDVMFDESASWYLPSPPTLENSIPSSEVDVNEAEMPPDER